MDQLCVQKIVRNENVIFTTISSRNNGESRNAILYRLCCKALLRCILKNKPDFLSCNFARCIHQTVRFNSGYSDTRL